MLEMFVGFKKCTTFATAKATKEKLNGALVQLVRIHACHAWGHGFESRTHRRIESSDSEKNQGSFVFEFFGIKKRVMWKYYALLSAFFAALTAIFAKIGVKNINSDLATAIRTSIILLITWGIVFSERQAANVKEVDAHTWLFLILSGAATGLSWLFYFKALQAGDVSRVAPIDKLSVVITICLSFLFLREPVSLRVIVGAILITCGSMVMLWK